ncbi:MAG TPA: S-methyl-5'-thioadenosine phosphorylase [Thermomicrobiaceae bacterium]|nr:S-methyl-5'-thioadenosine phosphorylase [Thermomicrobiaceae bacterium]
MEEICSPESRLVGVIGGSGLYDMPGLTEIERQEVSTPFGEPSAPITIGTIEGQRIAFIPRHGLHHQIGPSSVPCRANFWAFKSLGCTEVISISGVGSLHESIAPLDLVVPDQIIDRTVLRPRTFFDDMVAHVGIAEPFCADCRAQLIAAAEQLNRRVHEVGTYVCIEGPQFSTRAESHLYRSWGASVIGMTAMPEARLAREAGLCFAVLALVTDYDVWHETEAPVSVETVVQNLKTNVQTAQQVLRHYLAVPRSAVTCGCRDALKNAVVTAPEAISEEARQRLELLRR